MVEGQEDALSEAIGRLESRAVRLYRAGDFEQCCRTLLAAVQLVMPAEEEARMRLRLGLLFWESMEDDDSNGSDHSSENGRTRLLARLAQENLDKAWRLCKALGTRRHHPGDVQEDSALKLRHRTQLSLATFMWQQQDRPQMALELLDDLAAVVGQDASLLADVVSLRTVLVASLGSDYVQRAIEYIDHATHHYERRQWPIPGMWSLLRRLFQLLVANVKEPSSDSSTPFATIVGILEAFASGDHSAMEQALFSPQAEALGSTPSGSWSLVAPTLGDAQMPQLLYLLRIAHASVDGREHLSKLFAALNDFVPCLQTTTVPWLLTLGRMLQRLMLRDEGWPTWRELSDRGELEETSPVHDQKARLLAVLKDVNRRTRCAATKSAVLIMLAQLYLPSDLPLSERMAQGALSITDALAIDGQADRFVDTCRMLAHHFLYESKRLQAGFADLDARSAEELREHAALRDGLHAGLVKN